MKTNHHHQAVRKNSPRVRSAQPRSLKSGAGGRVIQFTGDDGEEFCRLNLTTAEFAAIQRGAGQAAQPLPSFIGTIVSEKLRALEKGDTAPNENKSLDDLASALAYEVSAANALLDLVMLTMCHWEEEGGHTSDMVCQLHTLRDQLDLAGAFRALSERVRRQTGSVSAATPTSATAPELQQQSPSPLSALEDAVDEARSTIHILIQRLGELEERRFERGDHSASMFETGLAKVAWGVEARLGDAFDRAFRFAVAQRAPAKAGALGEPHNSHQEAA